MTYRKADIVRGFDFGVGLFLGLFFCGVILGLGILFMWYVIRLWTAGLCWVCPR